MQDHRSFDREHDSAVRWQHLWLCAGLFCGLAMLVCVPVIGLMGVL